MPLDWLWRLVLLTGILMIPSVPGLGQVSKEELRTISFVFTDIDARPVRLADFRGKWVLVNFWAHWCPLCWVEVPVLNELNRRSDFVVIGVSLDYGTDLDAVRRAVAQHDLNFRAIIPGGARGDAQAAYRQVGPVDFFPTSYLYAPNGELVMFLPGQVRMDKVQSYVSTWRAKPGTALTRLAVDFNRLGTAVQKRYGAVGQKRLGEWRTVLEHLAAAPILMQLNGVNAFFNTHVTLDTDQHVWGRPDYWATPGETLATGRGDSENLAIAKYFSLLTLGVPAERLRLTYTRSAGGGEASWMVLAYYPEPNCEPLILDQRITEVRPAGERTELRPVFSFNGLGLWGDPVGFAAQGGNLSVWQDLLRRSRQEGFE